MSKKLCNPSPEYEYPSGDALPSWEGVKHLIHQAVCSGKSPSSSSSISQSITVPLSGFLSGLNDVMAWTKFLMPRAGDQKFFRDAVGLSFHDNQTGLDRDIVIDTTKIDASYEPPRLQQLDDDNQPKKKPRLDPPAPVVVKVYSTSHAIKLTTPLLDAVVQMIDDVIPADRKSNENVLLLLSILLQRLRYQHKMDDDKSLRDELKKLKKVNRDNALLIENARQLVKDMNDKGTRNKLQHHVLLTIARTVGSGCAVDCCSLWCIFCHRDWSPVYPWTTSHSSSE